MTRSEGTVHGFRHRPVIIFIACFCLIGLASFTAEQRRKEIGIRKVLGASVSNIGLLLSKEFILLVVGAYAIAAPSPITSWRDG